MGGWKVKSRKFKKKKKEVNYIINPYYFKYQFGSFGPLLVIPCIEKYDILNKIIKYCFPVVQLSS